MRDSTCQNGFKCMEFLVHQRDVIQVATREAASSPRASSVSAYEALHNQMPSVLIKNLHIQRVPNGIQVLTFFWEYP